MRKITVRIANTQVNSIFELHTNKVQSAQAASSTPVQMPDRFTMSAQVGDISAAKSALSSMSDVRLDKVSHYQGAVASGNYNVSDQDLAEAVLRNATS